MRRNPEFQRNLWLEITPHRLIATPLIMGAVYYLILFSGDNNESILLMTSLWVFVLVTGVWGASQAENSVVTEVQNKTWPLQRLTSIKPWTMVWGKLFGSTIFSWYAGLWSLLVFVLMLLLIPETILFDQLDKTWVLLSHGIGPAVLFTVGLILWFQAWGLLMGLYQLQNKEFKNKRRSGVSLLLGIFLLPALFSSFLVPARGITGFHWYQWQFDEFWFLLASVYLFLGWVLTGVYMQMRRELQVANPPWVWAAFMIFLAGYAMGFLQEGKNVFSGDLDLWVLRMMLGWALAMSLTYLVLWWDRSDGVDIRRLFHLWHIRRIRDALCEVPRWLVGLILAWSAAVALMVLKAGSAGAFTLEKDDPLNLYGMVIAMMFFLMRDIALLLYFYFSKKPQRALSTAMLYWVVLYLLIPLLLGVVWMDELSPLFIPDGSVHIAYAILPPLIQAALMWRFTFRRWRTRFGSPVA